MLWGEVLLLRGPVSVGTVPGAVGGSDGLSILGGPLDPFDAAYPHHKYAADGNATTGFGSSACGGAHSHHADEGFGDYPLDSGLCDDSESGPDLLLTSSFVGIEGTIVGTSFAGDAAGFFCLGSGESALHSGLVSTDGGGGDSAPLDDGALDSPNDEDPASEFSYDDVDEVALSTSGSKTSASWLMLRGAGKDTCRCFGGSTLASADLYDFHEGVCELLPPSAAVPVDEGRVDQGHSFVYNLPPPSAAVFGDEVPPAVEYLGPFLVLSLTVLGASWCVDPRRFRHRAQIKRWSDVSFRAFLPAMVAYVGYYFSSCRTCLPTLWRRRGPST